MSDLPLTERDGAVTTLTLNRPHKRNALSADLVEALLAALSQSGADGTRLLVLKGAGSGGLPARGWQRRQRRCQLERGVLQGAPQGGGMHEVTGQD